MLATLTTVFHSPAFNHVGATFDTHIKSAGVASAITEQLPAVSLAAPRSADIDELRRIHEAEYVDALITGTPAGLAESNGFEWTPDLLTGVLASTGGMRDAALCALSEHRATGSLSSGLHHAGPQRGAGFCTVNGLALAALAARDAGASRVLILDLDAHCGGGTAAIIANHNGIEQVDVSVIGFDSYQTDRCSRLVMATGDNYLQAIERELADIATPDSIDLVIYNAGMDPHESAGGVAGITTEVIRDREQLVFAWAAQHDVPIAFALAGGYARHGFGIADVVELHMLTLHAAHSFA